MSNSTQYTWFIQFLATHFNNFRHFKLYSWFNIIVWCRLSRLQDIQHYTQAFQSLSTTTFKHRAISINWSTTYRSVMNVQHLTIIYKQSRFSISTQFNIQHVPTIDYVILQHYFNTWYIIHLSQNIDQHYNTRCSNYSMFNMILTIQTQLT